MYDRFISSSMLIAMLLLRPSPPGSRGACGGAGGPCGGLPCSAMFLWFKSHYSRDLAAEPSLKGSGGVGKALGIAHSLRGRCKRVSQDEIRKKRECDSKLLSCCFPGSHRLVCGFF